MPVFELYELYLLILKSINKTIHLDLLYSLPFLYGRWPNMSLYGLY